jgi:hypothetical protein
MGWMQQQEVVCEALKVVDVVHSELTVRVAVLTARTQVTLPKRSHLAFDRVPHS